MPPLDLLLSWSMLTAFLWSAAVLVPRSAREGDAFAMTCSLLTTFVALFMSLWVGVGAR